jgi:hypothetical protein
MIFYTSVTILSSILATKYRTKSAEMKFGRIYINDLEHSGYCMVFPLAFYLNSD